MVKALCRNRVLLNSVCGSKMGEKMCEMIQEVGRRTRKSQMQMKTEYEESMNQQYYLHLKTRLRESVQTKIPEFWVDKWIFHHENTHAYNALSVREFVQSKYFLHVLLSPKT
jgi:hypothetical protein